MLSLSSSSLVSFGGIAKPFSAPIRLKCQYTPLRTTINNPSDSMASPKWAQKTVTLPPQRRGCHLVTSKVFGGRGRENAEGIIRWGIGNGILTNKVKVQIMKEINQEIAGFKCGLAHLFLQHTSASLTINENYDSDVRDDTETFLSRVVPEGTSAPWKHTLEGPDDMPAHIKSSMFGCNLTIPITDGKLNMGTWQGIWLCEHRDSATPRRIVITLNGM
ncbi:hypothetical protein MTR67_050304 [Solanum verrucosum]|uniref:Uncharacterized protein n=1 Tax=Solanum verrucosum TaxID=315347 RepID=A0AAF0V493_SOLVR|nr:hypothetical protein MTR67_050304 [Solanum verrucosum]